MNLLISIIKNKYFIIVTLSLLIGFLYFLFYKIDKRGYDRCQSEYSAAAEKLKEEARVNIINSEKKYEKLKNEIIKIQGNNNVCGPRVEFAIDRMPDNNNGK